MLQRLTLLACFTLALGACGGGGGGGDDDTPTPLPTGDGTFQGASPAAVSVGDTPTALGAGDFDGNGTQDLVVAAHLGDRVDVLLGNGDGSFTAAPTVSLPAGGLAFDLRVAHLNADTHLDFVVSLSSTNQALVFHGDGSGGFATGPVLTVPGTDDAMGVAVGHFNGDAALDIAVVCRNPGTVGIYLGDGMGGYTAPAQATFSVGDEARNLRVANLDADNLLDLTVSVRNSQHIETYLGNGDGTFTASSGSPTATGGQPWTMAASDFDGDGTTDLLAAGENVDNVVVLAGDGMGGLTLDAQSPITVGDQPIGLATGDFTGDARHDAVIANLADGTLSVLINNGTGTFASGTPATIQVGALPFAIAVADFNGDGIQDIACANQGDDNVSILLGNASEQ